MSKSVNSFINNFKLKKSQSIVDDGNIVVLYNNKYKVIQRVGKCVILQDNSNYKFAIPADYLEKVVRKGGYSSSSLEKGRQADAIGTVRNGRKKIADGVWVDVNTKDLHTDHEGDEKTTLAPVLDKDEKARLEDFSKKIYNSIDPSEHGKIRDSLKELVFDQIQLKSMKQSGLKVEQKDAYFAVSDRVATRFNRLKDIISNAKKRDN